MLASAHVLIKSKPNQKLRLSIKSVAMHTTCFIETRNFHNGHCCSLNRKLGFLVEHELVVTVIPEHT